MKNYFDDFISLFYPRLCLACGKESIDKQEIVCLSCEAHLPKTNFHLLSENEVMERFWGRVPLKAATSMYFFTKGGRVQELMHRLKYEQKKEVGLKLGRIYGQELAQHPVFNTIDFIVPVPLHIKKERLRGYNQSALFATGLAEIMQKTHLPYGLQRLKMTETQTKKSRLERLENVAEVFHVAHPNRLEGKHILLVDDVLTTGATLEACANKLLKINGLTISIATIACASKG